MSTESPNENLPDEDKATRNQTDLILQKAEDIVASAGMDLLKTNRPWYRRKRWYYLLLILILVWYALIPTPLKITRESHFYDQPRYNNGTRVDYEKIYYDLQDQYLSKPEENGFRNILAALGPRTLEQAALAERISWDKIKDDKNEKNWWKNNWLPLCEKLKIDPNPQPKYLDYQPLEVWLIINGVRGDEPVLEKKELNTFVNYQQVPNRISFKESRRIVEKEIWQRPWTDKEFPQAAKWLEKFNPLLDLFQQSVRKPVYSSFHKSDDEYQHNAMMILLPDIQAQRELVRAVRVRINYRLAKKDINGAIDDLIGIFYLSNRMKKGVRCLVEHMLSLSIQRIGVNEAALLFQCGELTKEQLARLDHEFNSIRIDLQKSEFMEQMFNTVRLIEYSSFQYLLDNPDFLKNDKNGLSFFDQARMLTWDERWGVFFLPIDKNVAMRHFSQYLNELKKVFSQSDYFSAIKAYNELLNTFAYARKENRNLKYYLDLISIKKRSQIFADLIILDLLSGDQGMITALVTEKTETELFQIGLALERYKIDNGRWPKELAELVPAYLPSVPADPYRSDKPFVYRCNNETKEYLLYSVGPNKLEEDEKFKNHKPSDDIVFQRFGKMKNGK